MGIASIPQRIRSLQRLPQILSVMMKYGFGDVVARVGVDSVVHQLKRRIIPDYDQSLVVLKWEERIRLALEDLGPTFVKLGQVMATRPDLLPMSLIVELRKLQDKVKPFDEEGIRSLVEDELGQPIDELFSEFTDKPLAAASIAQVHRATLKDGRKVVLKIQRPNLERIIGTDLDILTWLAQLAEDNLPELRRYSPAALVEEFESSITKEIDFEVEAYHMRRFAKNFADDDGIYVPEVVDELTTSKILCEDFVPGLPLNHPDVHTREDVDKELIVRRGIKCILEQALVHGFFHADPHPGNIFVLPGSNALCFIDYGMMGMLDQQRIDELLTFLVAILTRDLDKLIHLFTKLELIGEDTDVRKLRREVDDLIARFESTDLADLNIGRYLNQVFEVVIRHDVQVPSDLLLVGKALATIEGVGRDLFPELNTLEEIRPVILRIYLGRLTDPTYYARTPRHILEGVVTLLETGPRDLRLVLKKMRQGELRTNLRIDQFEEATRAQSQAANRLALTILTATFVATSAYLFTHSDLTPWIGQFPLSALLGVLALGLAALYGAILTIGFLRSGAF